jgi:hypothetical protein
LYKGLYVSAVKVINIFEIKTKKRRGARGDLKE